MLKLPVPSTKHAQLINCRFSVSYLISRTATERELHSYGAKQKPERTNMVHKRKPGTLLGNPANQT